MRKRKAVLLLLAIPLLLLIPTSRVNADGINVDGVVDETEWTWWFKDDSQEPYVDVYWYMDSVNLYIGIVTDDTNENDDVFQFAFRASELDYWFEIKPGVSTKFRPSGGDWEGWWKKARNGLPPGVNAAAGKTDGRRSYEILIELSLLGNKAVNFPEKFKFWFMVLDGTPNGPTNYYPDSRAGWWFQIEIELDDGEDFLPEFVIPELPVGTIMALLSTFAALILFTRKQLIFKK